MTFEYVAKEQVELKNSLLVSGLPAVGMEGTVAASFLAQQLNMRVIGAFQSLDLPPVGAVRGGIATSPIQVWAAELACGVDGRCDHLLVLKSDLPIPPPLQMPLAGAVAAWAREHGITLIIGLDTYADTKNGEGPSDVLVAASLKAADLVTTVKAKPLTEALITGFTAALLMRANREQVAAIGLFAPSTVPEAEADGTTALIETARPLIPRLEVETSQLLKVIEQQSVALRHEREQQAEEARRMRDLVDRGYL